MKPRRSCLPWLLLLSALIVLSLVALGSVISMAARLSFGEPVSALNPWQSFIYSCELVWNTADLTQPSDPAGAEQLFAIDQGESVTSISNRLQRAGLIRNAHAFRTYLIWTGMDTTIQPGKFRLSPTQTGRDIARMLESTTLTDVTFHVLPGWRLEEIAAALPTSGLDISPEAFLAAAAAPANAPAFLLAGSSSEGFLAPGEYVLPRIPTTAEQLVSALIDRFSAELTTEMQAGFASQGLPVYQAVTLASIVQREAVVADEMPVIASVFYNRLRAGMPLQSDPTIQYALGYNAAQATWWTNPLSADDMHFDSPYNTYIYSNLPPGPISNPGTPALMAVANPAQTAYYFFQAKCDGSGLHNFAETFEQHQQNYCP
jgi:UPF0755 protein